MESEEQLYAAYSQIASNNNIFDDRTVVKNISRLLTNSQDRITDSLKEISIMVFNLNEHKMAWLYSVNLVQPGDNLSIPLPLVDRRKVPMQHNGHYFEWR